MIETKILTEDRFQDFVDLMKSDSSAAGCMCTWWIISVKDYHSNGSAGNLLVFQTLLNQSTVGMGIVAYDSGAPVGWCACGPRSRYVRAIKTPTFKGRQPLEDNVVWLVPCFFVKKEYQNKGITSALLREAVHFAQKNNAIAIEGFPFCKGRKHITGDLQAGFEATFEDCGFQRSRSNSDNRVIMRLDL